MGRRLNPRLWNGARFIRTEVDHKYQNFMGNLNMSRHIQTLLCPFAALRPPVARSVGAAGPFPAYIPRAPVNAAPTPLPTFPAV